MFESYGLNELNLTSTVPLILANEGVETGLGIDLGDGATQVSSVIGGIQAPDYSFLGQQSGKDLTISLMDNLL